jgi:hypothetical protein
MKTFMRKYLYLFVVPILLTGCASIVRPVTDVALGAAGAGIGNKLSGGDPFVTAGSGAAGVLLGEGIYAWKSRSDQKAYVNGFQKGRSDGVKQLYWNLQAEQRNTPGSFRDFELRVPAHRDGGVLFDETKQNIRN